MSKKIKLPDGNSYEAPDQLVTVWVEQKNGQPVKPYPASFSPRDWAKIDQGYITGQILHDPVEAQKEAEKAKKARAKKLKEENDATDDVVKRTQEASKLTPEDTSVKTKPGEAKGVAAQNALSEAVKKQEKEAKEAEKPKAKEDDKGKN